jgi:hypothetical protein
VSEVITRGRIVTFVRRLKATSKWLKKKINKKKERRIVSCVPTPHARAYMMSPYNDRDTPGRCRVSLSITNAAAAAVRSQS